MGGHLEPSTSWRRPSRRVLGSSWNHLVLSRTCAASYAASRLTRASVGVRSNNPFKITSLRHSKTRRLKGSVLDRLGAISGRLGNVCLTNSFPRPIENRSKIDPNMRSIVGSVLDRLGGIWGRLVNALASKNLSNSIKNRSNIDPKIAPRRLPRRAPTWLQLEVQLGGLRGAENVENVERAAPKKPVASM